MSDSDKALRPIDPVMADPEVVTAAAMVVSATAAVLAVLLSALGLVRSRRADRRTQRTREAIGRVQEQMSEHLAMIAETLATQAPQQSVTQPAAGHPSSGVAGGRLSAEFLRGERGRGETLRIVNTGDEPAEVVDVQVLEQPDLLVRGGGDPHGAVLDPNEHFDMLAAMTLANSLPLKVLMRWRDSRGISDRVQYVR